MAILSKIRQRSILLVLIIALALFSFVLADVIKSGGFSSGSNNIGSVNGTKFEYQEFMNKVANAQKSQQGAGSPVIRGFEASRILLLVDGVRMNNLIFRAGHLQNIITEYMKQSAFSVGISDLITDDKTDEKITG